jgi:hypothetical protein
VLEESQRSAVFRERGLDGIVVSLYREAHLGVGEPKCSERLVVGVKERSKLAIDVGVHSCERTTPVSEYRTRRPLAQDAGIIRRAVRMNNDEARQIVRQELTNYRKRSYAELTRLVGSPIPTLVLSGASETEYQVEIQVQWDDQPHGAIRVIGGIDDGGWRAFAPLSEDFVVRPDDVVLATW